MRIAIVGPSSPREFAEFLDVRPDSLPVGLGGTPVNSLVRSLLRHGHAVHLVTASPDIASTKRFDADKFHISIVPYRKRARARALDLFRAERNMMSKELNRVPTDVVHAHWSYEFGWVGVTSGLPQILSIHDAPLTILRRMPDAYRILRLLLAYAVRTKASHVTAVSPDLAKKWRRQMFFPGDVRVIPNITPEFDLSDDFGGLPSHPVITDIADSTPLKNVRTLLTAFKEFRFQYPEAELRLIGSGLEDEGELARWAADFDLKRSVKFLGRQSRVGVSMHLRESEMLCHVSLEESQGMCFLEAMSHSVPVIGGHDSGGVAWTLGEGDAGLLVDVRKSEDVLRGLLRLHEDRELRASLIQHGHALLSERYSADAVTCAYIDCYEQAISSFRKPPSS